MSAGSVLVVDDNPLIVNILKGLFASEEYDVHVSRNGREALEALQQTPVDVVVCDVMMPEMDGYQLLEELRQRGELSHVPFVFLTALGQEDERVRGHVSGADDYIIKPFDPRELLAIVQGKIERSRLLRAQISDQHDKYRRRVIQTLSHEFRTPLVAISTGAELLLGAGDRLGDDKARGLIEAIQRGGARLERLVNDFMVMQQIEAGVVKNSAESKAQQVILSELFETFFTMVKQMLPGDFICSTANSAAGEQLSIYPSHILEALKRIVDNAAKFSQESRRIELRCDVLNAYGRISVCDWGIGIEPEAVAEMTALFGQVGRELHEQQGGGLGLPIASALVQANGGELEIATFENHPPIVLLEGESADEMARRATVVSVLLPLWS